MKKKTILYLIVILLIFTCNVYAHDNKQNATYNPENVELILNNGVTWFDSEEIQSASISEEYTAKNNKTLKEKISDAYRLDTYKYDNPDYLLKEVLTHYYSEDSLIEKTHIWGAFNGDIGLRFSDNGSSTNHFDFNALNIGFDGFLKNNNADFRIMFGIVPNSPHNMVQRMFSDVYVATNKIPHHRAIVGYTRPPAGKEGGNSAYTLPFYTRSQIARNFGTARKLGVRLQGDYDFIDYDIGAFSSDTFLQEFFPGSEFIGWVNIKPLAKTNEKYGNLKIGGGIQGGHRDNNYFVTGAYAGWEYKKFSADFEWANANGYNGYAMRSSPNHAGGFYTTLKYKLTKKLELLARYDEFNSNKNLTNNISREFSIGMNYYIKGQALKLILDYVFCQNDGKNNSHRIILGTQILI